MEIGKDKKIVLFYDDQNKPHLFLCPLKSQIITPKNWTYLESYDLEDILNIYFEISRSGDHAKI